MEAEVLDTLPVPDTSNTFALRVFSYVDAIGDCWIWTGGQDRHGYGRIGRGRRGAGTMAAHRAVWELLVGPISEGMEYDHLCRNRLCVKPDHGEPVTPEVNKARGFGAGALYARRDTCNQGHPLDGVLGKFGGKRTHRYCKACAREKVRMQRESKQRA